MTQQANAVKVWTDMVVAHYGIPTTTDPAPVNYIIPIPDDGGANKDQSWFKAPSLPADRSQFLVLVMEATDPTAAATLTGSIWWFDQEGMRSPAWVKISTAGTIEHGTPLVTQVPPGAKLYLQLLTTHANAKTIRAYFRPV